ncbi:hypothetical protein, partial [Staphylococcus aureus]
VSGVLPTSAMTTENQWVNAKGKSENMNSIFHTTMLHPYSSVPSFEFTIVWVQCRAYCVSNVLPVIQHTQ